LFPATEQGKKDLQENIYHHLPLEDWVSRAHRKSFPERSEENPERDPADIFSEFYLKFTVDNRGH
jgi:hypothetical protein